VKRAPPLFLPFADEGSVHGAENDVKYESLPSMHLTGRPRRKARRKTDRRAAPDAGGRRCDADPAKAKVMAYVELLIRDGFARCSRADNGVIELTLSTSEVFHFGETSVTRII
jgi:hypothetical protein